MQFSSYLKDSIWDFLLVALASIALSYTLLDSFYIDPNLQYTPLAAVVSVVLVAILFVIAFNKKSTKLGIIVYAVLCAILLAVGAVTSGGSPLDDTESSHFFLALVLVLTPTIVFLLSRKRGLTAILFIVGVAICAWIQFFYERYELVWDLLFVFSSLALIVYKNFQLSARTATSVRSVSFPAGFGVAAGSVALCGAVAAAVWFGIIAPLNPGALQIKLVTEYKALETVQVHGTSKTYEVPNMDMTSNRTNDDERTTDDMQIKDDGRPTPANYKSSSKSNNDNNDSSGSFLGIDTDSLQQTFDFQNNTRQAVTALLLLLLIPIAIVAYFVGRRIWRNHRLKKIQQLPPSGQVQELYRFLTGRLGKVGIAVPVGATALEYARNNENSMEAYNHEAGVNFTDLTKSFVRVSYGKGEATEEEAQGFARFYKGFWKAARKQLGVFKYFLRSFRLG